MKLYVVDAGVVAKWFLPEEHAEEARRLAATSRAMHAPDYLTLELGHILCKKVRRSELTQARADAILDVFRGVPVQFHAWGGLFDQAFEIAGQTRRGLYDCLYVALAIGLGGEVVTADRKLYDALAPTALAPYLMWVGDLPGELPNAG